MPRFVPVAPLLLFALLLALATEGLAGPSCARRNQGNSTCPSTCKKRWGYPGRVMGTDPWGQVMTVTMTDMGSVLTKACRVRPTPSSSSSPSSAAVIPTSAGVANVGGALPSFVSVSSSTVFSNVASAVQSTSLSLSSSVVQTTALTSQILSPASTSRFITSFTSAASVPPPSPTPKQPSPEPSPQPSPEPAPSPVQVSEDTAKPSTTSQAPPPAQTTATQAPPPAQTTTAQAPQTTESASASASGSDASSSDIEQYLNAHNTVRAQHGAVPLTWSNELASKAQQWANGCVFQHSGGTLGPFGENLAAGTGSSYDIATAVGSWTSEVSQYDPNNPVPSHFTQVVWKATTQVGCAEQQCSGIFAASFGLASYFVCEYSVQGNVIGEFAQNVQV
ncbi:uncharacterized protein PHACADRAFT_247249 [Phanerochaete carnosa HHB-10118-sp]|uniref:SCP domain-containing protein n=1 Tax=Phanerochaete carnosa (strain HHB-10118-sp) TaxID=650164 RepID=K5WAM0_PHACS|nr:uncharacterized protein PHACADRAFT_247249 [Phanerochaete carnosa HHB-10118-sp]EKM60983.1 hypothetical protein PHACADRAFT_247249 [Phanerochaete carnosa HHB-10118-sp]